MKLHYMIINKLKAPLSHAGRGAFNRVGGKRSSFLPTRLDIPHRFLALLAEDNARHHNMQYFADQLCISAKYLSFVVRTETGKTPSAWIKDMLIKQIRYYLLETNLTIKEICHKLHFENPSFFGKFTKQHLGCSPLEFRNGGHNTI